MLLVPVQSSDISAAGYDPDSGEMQIQFRKEGTIYSYQNIPPALYEAFITASSKGSFFAQNIRKYPALYPYTKLGAMETPQTQNEQPSSALHAVLNPVESAIQRIEGFLP